MIRLYLILLGLSLSIQAFDYEYENDELNDLSFENNCVEAKAKKEDGVTYNTEQRLVLYFNNKCNFKVYITVDAKANKKGNLRGYYSLFPDGVKTIAIPFGQSAKFSYKNDYYPERALQAVRAED